MLTDPVADMLTRIRNANKALHDRSRCRPRKLKEEIARLLKDEGYIERLPRRAGRAPVRLLMSSSSTGATASASSRT